MVAPGLVACQRSWQSFALVQLGKATEQGPELWLCLSFPFCQELKEDLPSQLCLGREGEAGGSSVGLLPSDVAAPLCGCDPFGPS